MVIVRYVELLSSVSPTNNVIGLFSRESGIDQVIRFDPFKGGRRIDAHVDQATGEDLSKKAKPAEGEQQAG